MMEYQRMFKVNELLDDHHENEGNFFAMNKDKSVVRETNEKDTELKLPDKADAPVSISQDIMQTTKKTRTCHICGKTFPTVRNCRRHIKQLHSENVSFTRCEICYKLLKEGYIALHMKRYHSGSVDIPVQCGICGETFRNDERLKCHMKVVHIDFQIPCSLCDKKFKNRYYLKTHLVTHSHEPYSFRSSKICPVCGKSMKHLGRHMQEIHADHTTASCDICGKVFSSEVRLKYHKKRIHVHIVKNHMCEICGVSFKTKMELCNHYVVHSDVRKFKCDICDKTFKLKCVLETHKRVHSAVQPYTCKKCGESFKWKGTFDKHVSKCPGVENVAADDIVTS